MQLQGTISAQGVVFPLRLCRSQSVNQTRLVDSKVRRHHADSQMVQSPGGIPLFKVRRPHQGGRAMRFIRAANPLSEGTVPYRVCLLAE